MYRFETIEDYRSAFEKAYVDGLEKDVFDDFDAIALLLMYVEVGKAVGRIEGIMDVQNAFRQSTPEMEADTAFKIELIKNIVEVSAKKLEELGLL